MVRKLLLIDPEMWVAVTSWGPVPWICVLGIWDLGPTQTQLKWPCGLWGQGGHHINHCVIKTFQEKIEKNLDEDDSDAWIPVDVSFIKEFWLPDAEILNLKEFETLNVLSKLEGLWLNRNFEIMYAVATRITFICPMTFNSFPLDVQVCLFQVRRCLSK